MRILQNFQQFRVRVWKCYRTSRSSGHCGTGLPSHPTKGLQQNVSELLTWGTQYLTRKMTSKAFVRATRRRFYALVLQQYVLVKLLHWPAGPHMRNSIAQGRFGAKSATPIVGWLYHRTHRSSERVQSTLYPYPGYCGHGRTEVPEVPGTGMNVVQNFQKFRVRVWMPYRTYKSSLKGNTRVNTPGTVCTYPTEHNVGKKIYNVCIYLRWCCTNQLHSRSSRWRITGYPRAWYMLPSWVRAPPSAYSLV